MKTKLLTLALLSSLLLGVQTTHAQDSVYSNVVGMVKVDIPANGLFLGTYNLVPVAENGDLITEIIGTDLPIGTTLYVWDRNLQEYKLPAPVLNENPFTNEKAWSRTDITISLGDAFFIKNGNPDESVSVTFTGNVPDDEDPVLIPNVNGFVGYPFPSEIDWANTQLAENVPVGTTLFIWNSEQNSYNLPGPVKSQNPFTNETSWSSNPVIMPGNAIWLSVDGSPPDIQESAPYSLD